MTEYPNLAGVATENLTSQIGTGSYSASYINWARTMQLLREHAPGWLPELVPNANGGFIHQAPKGAYLMIRFVHADGSVTPAVPQSIMDNKNKAVPLDEIHSRDITDTHVRGVCKAAALTFGLAYELWAKMPLESGYADREPVAEPKQGQPLSGVWEGMPSDIQLDLLEVAKECRAKFNDGKGSAEEVQKNTANVVDYLEKQGFDNDLKAALWTQLDSKIRAAITKEIKARKVAA